LIFWRIARSRGIIPLVLILVAFGYWRLHSRPPQYIAVEHIGERSVTLWNSLAQVRQPVGDLHYGDRVEVVREVGSSAQVRTASGELGWLLDSRQMMDATVWDQSAALLARVNSLPVQAIGRTKTVSNLRIEPGRNGKRIFQLIRGTPVQILERMVADAPQSSDAGAAVDKDGTDDVRSAKESWLLVKYAPETSSAPVTTAIAGRPAEQVRPASENLVMGSTHAASTDSADAEFPTPPIAGWVLARFIEPDLPGPVRDYASSANLHVIAWFELNRVPDGSGGEAPQYLVAGAPGGEGQICDFTMLRVYTWSTARKRYETAYVESNLCGHLPIRVSRGPEGPAFRFTETGDRPGESTYLMRQTVVRRVKEKSSVAPVKPGGPTHK
jgi:hypothetical protein